MNLKKKFNITQWDEYKLNYWAIPKCANTAVKTALSSLTYRDKMAYSKVKWVHNPDNVLYIDRKTARNNGYYNFSVTRHPYDRFISLYKDQGLRRPMFKDYSNISIDDFLTKLENYNISNDPHTRTQISYLFKGNKLLVDKIVCVTDAKNYLQTLGIELNYVNKTQDIELTLTENQKQRVYQIYKDDFIKLGYDNE
jgi:hypothetical protein